MLCFSSWFFSSDPVRLSLGVSGLKRSRERPREAVVKSVTRKGQNRDRETQLKQGRSRVYVTMRGLPRTNLDPILGALEPPLFEMFSFKMKLPRISGNCGGHWSQLEQALEKAKDQITESDREYRSLIVQSSLFPKHKRVPRCSFWGTRRVGSAPLSPGLTALITSRSHLRDNFSQDTKLPSMVYHG